MDEINWVVERAIDEAFVNDRYMLSMYKYLSGAKAKRKDATEFLEKNSSNLENLIEELRGYCKGGNQTLLEAYRHVGKTKAKKIANYLEKIIQDAKDYEHDKRPGRRKGTKNKRTLHK